MQGGLWLADGAERWHLQGQHPIQIKQLRGSQHVMCAGADL